MKNESSTSTIGMVNDMNKKENPMDEGRRIIIDLVNRIKYEVTEDQLSELSGCANPLGAAEFADWHARIDDLDLNGEGALRWFRGETAGQIRALLHRLVGLTRDVGGRAVQIGKRIVKWLLHLCERYPRTLKVAVVMAGLAFLVAQIPILNCLLLPIVQIVAVGVVGYVFISEYVEMKRLVEGA